MNGKRDMMNTVAIVGLGLIGGSFARALRERTAFRGQILGVSAPPFATAALRAGVIDQIASLEQALPIADLVYLSSSVSKIINTVPIIDSFVRPGTLITDVGSTKAQIVSAARQHIHRSTFVGGHPLAGREVRGVEGADPDLFEGRTYFLCYTRPSDRTLPRVAEFRRLVNDFGAHVADIDDQLHDELVALTSHLPQLASTALAAALARTLGPDRVRAGAGSGLASMTRLAQSGYEGLWKDILLTNRSAIVEALRAYIDELEQIRNSLLQDPGNPARSQFELGGKLAKLLHDDPN